MLARRCLVLITLALVALSAQPLLAQDTAPGWQAFVAAQYEKAANQGAKAGTADGYALACRSATVQGGFFETGTPAVKWLHKALDHCEQALARDKNHLIAGMTYAMTIALEGKRLTKASYAKRARAEFERLITLYPQNPMVHAGLAGWHAQVHAAGFFARTMLGGSRKKARAGFETALALEADAKGSLDLPLRLEYAKFLARGSKKERQSAQRVLSWIGQATPSHGYDALTQTQAQAIKAALETGEKSVISDVIRKNSAFYGIMDWDDVTVYPLKNSP